MQAYFGWAKPCSCSWYCCSRHLWFYDSGRLGRVEIVTLTVGARANFAPKENASLQATSKMASLFAAVTNQEISQIIKQAVPDILERWGNSVWKFLQVKRCLFDLNLSMKPVKKAQEVLLEILDGGVPLGSPYPDPLFKTKKCNFQYPFETRPLKSIPIFRPGF